MPGAHTDGIFAIIGEELGFIGCAVVHRAVRVPDRSAASASILRARDDFGSLLAVGIVSWIGYQALINIGGITRTLPLTGIPLPFLSYGGSALLAMLAGVGILLSVSRYGVDAQSLAKRDRSPSTAPTRSSARRARRRARSAAARRLAASRKGAR